MAAVLVIGIVLAVFLSLHRRPSAPPQRLTVAQTHIAYVSRGEIHVIDADGKNDRVLTHGGIALSPSWRHDGGAIVYAELGDGGTRIMQVDVRTGTTIPLTLFGFNITPAYTPDDRAVIYVRGSDSGAEGETELVELRLDRAAPTRRIRVWPGSVSSPTLSPDGRRIAFAATEPGGKTPLIYSIGIDGMGERLETPGAPGVRTYRTSPDWSPNGQWIAFEQQQHGFFQLWLLAYATRAMHPLAIPGENEDPAWAPDGRSLAFTSTRNGARNIWLLDTTTGALRQLTQTGDARLAAWSP